MGSKGAKRGHHWRDDDGELCRAGAVEAAEDETEGHVMDGRARWVHHHQCAQKRQETALNRR